MRDHDVTFINMDMWEKRNNWTKQVIIQPSWDVDENRMSAVYLEACSRLHKFCVHNTLNRLRLERASSWLNVMSNAMRLLTSANLRIAFIHSFKAGSSHRHPRRPRGDCAERHRRDPPVHLQVEWGGEQHYVGDLELPVESAWHPVLQISICGKSSSAPGFLQLQDVLLWLCYLRWHMKKCFGSQLAVAHASFWNVSIPCLHLVIVFTFIYSQLLFELLYLLMFSQSDLFPQCSDKTPFHIKAAHKVSTQLQQKAKHFRFTTAWKLFVVTFCEHHLLNIHLGLC